MKPKIPLSLLTPVETRWGQSLHNGECQFLSRADQIFPLMCQKLQTAVAHVQKKVTPWLRLLFVK